MRTKTTSITELPASPDEERRARMIRYTVAMGIRMVCIVLCVVLPDWWRVIPAVGAIALPYFAVVIANNVSRRTSDTVLRPGSIVPVAPAAPSEDAA
ncbi:MAG: DUF3099 domain-containing protein [Pseudolysinimonas sp.]